MHRARRGARTTVRALKSIAIVFWTQMTRLLIYTRRNTGRATVHSFISFMRERGERARQDGPGRGRAREGEAMDEDVHAQ